MADPVRATPLSHRSALAADDNSLRIHELPFADKHILRADHAAASTRVTEALGLRLPVKPLTSTKKGNDAALWLGPDEWLLVAADSKIKSLAPNSKIKSLADTHAQLTCVSDYYTTIGIDGPNARFALSKLTTLDLHPRVWRAGMVGGALFGQANGWLWLVRDTRKAGPEFRL
ncbi:MAG: sarcosine oxidase subunit gamma, partial [Alphaproteobacteria bacterium]